MNSEQQQSCVSTVQPLIKDLSSFPQDNSLRYSMFKLAAVQHKFGLCLGTSGAVEGVGSCSG